MGKGKKARGKERMKGKKKRNEERRERRRKERGNSGKEKAALLAATIATIQESGQHQFWNYEPEEQPSPGMLSLPHHPLPPLILSFFSPMFSFFLFFSPFLQPACKTIEV